MESECCVGRRAIRSWRTDRRHRACLKLAIGSRPQRRVRSDSRGIELLEQRA